MLLLTCIDERVRGRPKLQRVVSEETGPSTGSVDESMSESSLEKYQQEVIAVMLLVYVDKLARHSKINPIQGRFCWIQFGE